MKILFLNPSGELGGAERSLLDLMASLAAERLDLSLIAAGHAQFVDYAEAIGVKTLVKPFTPIVARMGDSGLLLGNRAAKVVKFVGKASRGLPGVCAYVASLRKAIRNISPDIVHSNGFKMHLLASWSSPKRIPVVWHVRDFIRSRPVMSRALSLNSRRCASVVAISESVARDVHEIAGGRLEAKVIYDGINLEEFSPEGTTLDLDSAAGLTAADPAVVKVGLVATFARWKGHETFLRALSLMQPDLPFRGYIVGGPIYQTDGSQYSTEELCRIAAQAGIGDRVGFTGFVNDPAAAMRSLDVVVHASTAPEPLGRVILEGMALRKAVIASKAGGVAELVSEGNDGLTHEPGSAELLADRLTRLVQDPNLRARLGDGGWRTAQERFDRRRLAAQIVPLYERLASAASN